eukprot:1191374-Prorocentrum_minimum.AAC.8
MRRAAGQPDWLAATRPERPTNRRAPMAAARAIQRPVSEPNAPRPPSTRAVPAPPPPPPPAPAPSSGVCNTTCMSKSGPIRCGEMVYTYRTDQSDEGRGYIPAGQTK